MTKRSAIMMAAGLAAALLVGVAAISLTMSPSSAAHARGHRAPIVRHHTQTVTIHRKPDTTSAKPPVQVVHLGSTASPGVTTMTSAGYEHESEGSFDDGPEGGSSGSMGDD